MIGQADNLRSLAEVSVALTGFTGIVVALGRRAGGEWSPLELLRLRMLLETSLAVLFLSLLPLLLQELDLAEDALWRIADGVEAAVYTLGGLALLRRQRGLGPGQWPDEEKKLTAVLLPVSLALVGAQFAASAGSLSTYAAFLFFVGLVYLLALAAIHFVLLLIPG